MVKNLAIKNAFKLLDINLKKTIFSRRMFTEIADASHFKKVVIDPKGLKVVKFSATWCVPCQKLHPLVEKLSKNYEGKVVFCNLDVDANDSIAAEYQVSLLPTLHVFRDNQSVKSFVGGDKIDALDKFLKESLAEK